MKNRFLISILLASVSLALAQSSDVRVTVDEVKDNRTTGDHFANLEIKLKLAGDSLDGATQVKTGIQRATDDTGRSLIKDEQDDRDEQKFQRIYSSKTDRIDCTLRLRNPARKATVIKELVGEVQVYVPKADPAAVVSVEQFLAKTGTLIASATLKAAGVEATALTKEQADAQKAQQEKETKEKSSKGGNTGALGQAFGQMFTGFMRGGENSILLKLTDPKSQVISIEFADARGKSIRPQMWTTSGETWMFDFSPKLPADTTLRIMLATPKALIKVPIKLTDIVLP
ncbi:MAG: hypothetical protein WCV00_17030 [Verrucomicrobiia bacterium]|jgi:hypothetical protein